MESRVSKQTGARGALTISGLYKEFGGQAVVRGIDLDVAEGTMVSLLGPSGCGKTTTLRMVAGLEDPDGGSIQVGDRVISGDRVNLPPEKRDMGMVFQTYALWPHMDVFANVAYGLRRHRIAKDVIEGEVRKVLALVGMERYKDRYPSQLSGGQQQRVALARAIANSPSILLFDEPLSNLDAVLRETMRFEIRALQQRLGTTGVYVTHSQDEALALSDRLAIMRDGIIIQEGPPEEVYERPRTEFVASFIGLANVLRLDDVSATDNEFVGTLASGSPVRGSCRLSALRSGKPDGAVSVAIRPEKLGIERTSGTPPPGDGLNLVGTVSRTNFTGSIVDYFVDLGAGIEVRVQSTPPVLAAAGDAVRVSFAPEHVVFLDEEPASSEAPPTQK